MFNYDRRFGKPTRSKFHMSVSLNPHAVESGSLCFFSVHVYQILSPLKLVHWSWPTVMECRPVSSRLITIRLRAAPFNITIVPAYAPTLDYDDNKIEEFYDQLQNVIDQMPKKDILVVQGDWNADVGKDACGTLLQWRHKRERTHTSWVYHL